MNKYLGCTSLHLLTILYCIISINFIIYCKINFLIKKIIFFINVFNNYLFSDDTLLDEDLGDEEYDLGNDEEEALLADDYELERVSILLDHYFVVK